MRPLCLALLLALGGCDLFAPIDDVRAPLVELTRPGAGAVVGGHVLLRVRATAQGEENEVSLVTVAVDGARAGEAERVSGPGEPAVFAYRLASGAYDDGVRLIQATAFDSEGNRGLSGTVEVTFRNGVAGGVAAEGGPRASVVAPRAGETVRGVVQVLVESPPGQPEPTRVDFLIDGVGVASDTLAPFAYAWDAAAETPGPHTVQARVYAGDAFGLTDAVPVEVVARDEGRADCAERGCVRLRRAGFRGVASGGVAVGFGGELYVGTSADTVYAFAPDGTLRWKRGGGASAVLVSNSEGVFAAGGTQVYGYSPLGRPAAWDAYDAGADVSTALAIGTDGTLYFGSRDGRLHAVDSFTGRSRAGFPVQLGAEPRHAPVVTRGGTVLVPTGASVVAVGPDGAERWRQPTGEVTGPVALAEREEQTLTGTRTVTSAYVPVEQGLLVVAASDGALEQEIALAGRRPGGPVVSPDGTLYVGTSAGLEAVRVDVSDGQPRGLFVVEGGRGVPALDASGSVYQVSGQTLRAVNPSGTPAFSHAIGSRASGPLTIGRDGVLYLATDDGLLVGLNTGASGLARGGWPMFQRNGRHTGRLGADADD